MAVTAVGLIKPCLEKISEAASGRKFAILRHEAKNLLNGIEETFNPQTPVQGSRAASHEPEAAAAQATPPAAALATDVHAPSERSAGSVTNSETPSTALETPAAPPTASPETLADEPEASQPDSSSMAQASEHAPAAEPHVDLDASAADTAADAASVPEATASETAAMSAPATPKTPAQSQSESTRSQHEQMTATPPASQPSPRVPLAQSRQQQAKSGLPAEGGQKLMQVLAMAVDTRKVPMVEAAVDLVQKLIAHQFLIGPVYSIGQKGDTAARKPAKRRVTGDEDDEVEVASGDVLPHQAQAVELLCRCDDIPDENIELRVLKGLLSTVASTTIHIHGQALLLAIRTCYNIFLMSRNEVNQMTAKASLTQMLNVTFQRMEAGSELISIKPIMVTDMLGLPPAETSTLSAFVQSFLHEVVTTVDAATFGYTFGIQEGIQHSLDDAFTRPDPSASSHGYLNEQDSPTADREQIQWRPSAGGEEGPPASPSGRSPADGQSVIRGVLQKDAFLVFRALCRLSIRSSDSAAATDLSAARGKVLALELLKILLENSGPTFRTQDKFVNGIKQHLCLSLLKNAAATHPTALALTSSIFFTLMTRFRHSLKAEIGVFFPMILLRAIEPAAAGTTPNAANVGGAVGAVDLAHKGVVMRCLEAQCESGQLLVDLFVNYDCDLEGANLFERMVLALVRIAQGTQDKDASAPQAHDEEALRMGALQCLVNILRSLVEWYTRSVTDAVPADSHRPVPEGNVSSSADVKESWNDLTSTPERILPNGDAVHPDPGAPGEPNELPPISATLSSIPMEGDVPLQFRDADSAKEAQLLETWKAYKKGFQEGISIFNKKPKKGISFLQEQGMLGRAPGEIAKFLQKTSGLNKTMIGEYLGEREEEALKVMHAYVESLDFTSLDFDAAIRLFLTGFRLPGEAQKIDRLMEKFAEQYLSCNPEAFKTADVAYVLAYSVIMLNTDAHNPQVKNKMGQQDFLKNNRGINDGGDLPQDYMIALYDRIVNDEIKMKDVDAEGRVAGAQQQQQQQQQAAGLMDTLLSLIPGRKAQVSSEPSDDSIKRTHDYLRERAKGATFFGATEGETVRPMLDVCWAPMLSAFSVLFDRHSEGAIVNLCLAGFVAAIRMTSLLGMGMIRNTYVTSLSRFTMLHSPSVMTLKNAKAFRALLVITDENGNHLHEVWPEVLRCVSRFELLQQMELGGLSDAAIFANPAVPAAVTKVKRGFLGRSLSTVTTPTGGKPVADSFTSIHDVQVHKAKGGKGDGAELQLPPDAVMRELDPQELNRMFVHSERLDSEAIVEFVRALCAIATEELRPASPRVYSLTKIVEIAHFNMNRIRLVWGRIWAVLADFFVEVGCHSNLRVAMFAVDSLRQLAMKFLERDELANYTFQNDFLKPFVSIMRQSKSVEIRELIIRCCSQMVFSRVNNVKSGWKSMFMVFTTAASDERQTIVRMAFDTIEKIVRDYFDFITETEITTFTDCVNCLIAFTNNPHSLDVALNAVAFLRFCAMKLAEGAIGDVEALPEGTHQIGPGMMRIRPAAAAANGDAPEAHSAESPATENGLPNGDPKPHPVSQPGQKRLQFSDKDEHLYFWFPLLAGLSELTFDPRPDLRHSALEVLFDTLRFHGSAFTTAFWSRVFDSVLLPIFDHVRAEVTDTTTFTDDRRREELDAWLYETCTQCLQHMVDIVVQFYDALQPLLSRIFDLLANFIRRTHQSLASVGVAASVRLINTAGDKMSPAVWSEALQMLSQAARDTFPDVGHLVSAGATAPATPSSPQPASPQSSTPKLDSTTKPRLAYLESASGSRMLSLVRCRATVQLLLVQTCGDVHSQHWQRMPTAALLTMLDLLHFISDTSRDLDADMDLRRQLASRQAEGQVAEAKRLGDPPLLRLERESSHAYLSMLLHARSNLPELSAQAKVEARLMQLCMQNLERFQLAGPLSDDDLTSSSGRQHAHNLLSQREESAARAPLVVATLRALSSFSEDAFRAHLRVFFPILTRLISYEHAPPEVQRALADIFTRRVAPLLQSS